MTLPKWIAACFVKSGALVFLPSLMCAALFLAAGLSIRPDPAPAETSAGAQPTTSPEAQFIGSERCVACHTAEHTDWLGSHHKAAMALATEATVLGDFNDATFSKDGVESTFFKKDGKFWVRTDGADGKLADFEIRYTFGIAPLQQYLIEIPGGRAQALGIAWDARPKESGGQRWYHLYPNQSLKAGNPLHWTGIDQNWNYQCAWCHSTNLRKNFSSDTGHFNTTWSEISVGCEACHGPASKHVEWASRPKDAGLSEDKAKGFAWSLDERKGASWIMGAGGQAARSVPRATAKEINVCAQCHARRQQFSDNPRAVGGFLDAFRPSNLDAGLYHSDGQQRDEVYNYGSFLQSKMHAAGVTCSDCHNPHSGKLRATGNAVCAQCHAPDHFDTQAHHHHAAGSAGSQCASCHMPTATYMGIDARHDHSMRLPRPDRSVMLGTPNACNQCHTDKNASWARDAIKTWYPSPKSGAQDFAEAFDLGDRGAPGALPALLSIASAETGSTIARASALTRLGRYLSPQVLIAAAQALQIDDPAVKTAAISVIAGADPSVRRTLLAPLLSDSSRLVRMDAARAIAGEAEAGLSDQERTVLEAALAEYVEAQLFNAERPESQSNLGALYRERGKMDDARKSFAKALELDPTFYAASISLADVARAGGDESGAEQVLRKSLSTNPSAGPVLHALGLSLIRQKRTAEALDSLTRAVEASPEDPRFNYVLAIALHDTGKSSEALGVLRNALARHPYDRDILWALASYEVEAGDYTSARDHAELLNTLEPNRTDVVQLLAGLRQNKP